MLNPGLIPFQAAEANDNSNAKRRKPPNEANGHDNCPVKEEEEAKDSTSSAGDEKEINGNTKPPEPPKDYIHVRARRGQATDSHSLAERVRIRCRFSSNQTHFVMPSFALTLLLCVLTGSKRED